MEDTQKNTYAEQIIKYAYELAVQDFRYGRACDKLAIIEHSISRLIGDPTWKAPMQYRYETLV